MMTSNKTVINWISSLEGVLPAETLTRARLTARARGQELERVLLREFGVRREDMLSALSAHYGIASVEYDERLPVPPDLLEGLNSDMLSMSLWFPVEREGETVLIAANDPTNPTVIAEVEEYMKGGTYEFRVALQEDIQWFVQDLLNAAPGYLIGTERTGLAYWRNNMAQWRTRLACYRTDLAKARTSLGVLRWGFGLIALALGFIRLHGSVWFVTYLYWAMMIAGTGLAVFGLANYLGIRRSRMSPPRHQTIVEVTSASMQFIERYHLDGTGVRSRLKKTMLARLGDFLLNYCTILKPVPASRERTHLARERNVLAAQRTLAACYRTMYARARTGLAFIRTGVVFLGLGVGFIKYFPPGPLTAADFFLVAAGVLMVFDGILWYLPARQEQENLLRVRAVDMLP
jgi:uncharacterized membrane protein YidH (DUF202 family)